MEFYELPFYKRMLTHYAICGVLTWIGWGNPDSFHLLMLIASIAFVFCYFKEFVQGHW